jgi:endonuclease YncB( thermonuclease family)
MGTNLALICLLWALGCERGITHPGGTDASGGHTDRATGGYHNHAKEAIKYTGTCHRIIDGDTFELKTDQAKVITIRLANIDTPEGNQPHGKLATAALETLIDGKQLTVTGTYQDQRGRFIGFVKVGRTEVNSRMVRDGHAWDFPRYSKGQYAAEQKLAQRAKRGLWLSGNPVPPWEWRKGVKK